MYYRGAVEDNNIFFAGKCWQIVRTTETGGTKLIYNGENTGTEDTPACENVSGESREIVINVSGNNEKYFEFSREGEYNSPAYIGYMYGNPYIFTNGAYTTGAYFGNSFTYDETNNVYTLVDTKVG